MAVPTILPIHPNGSARYACLLIAAAIILVVPLYLKRPAAFVLYCVALLGSLYALNAHAGLEWFAPSFFLKLMVAHLLPESLSSV